MWVTQFRRGYRHLFRSLAEQQADRLVGIILAGIIEEKILTTPNVAINGFQGIVF
jgi:hypothetical protein